MTLQKSTRVDLLATYQNVTGFSPNQIAESLGYSRGAARHWLNEGEMPKVVEIALEARLKVERPPASAVMLAAVPEDQRDIVERFLSAMRIDYKFVEIDR